MNARILAVQYMVHPQGLNEGNIDFQGQHAGLESSQDDHAVLLVVALELLWASKDVRHSKQRIHFFRLSLMETTSLYGCCPIHNHHA